MTLLSAGGPVVGFVHSRAMMYGPWSGNKCFVIFFRFFYPQQPLLHVAHDVSGIIKTALSLECYT